MYETKIKICPPIIIYIQYPGSTLFSCKHGTLYVTLSVGRFVSWSVMQSKNTLKGDLTWVTAIAHPYKTDAVGYTALFC